MTDVATPDRSPITFPLRAAIGLLQGLALFALLRAGEQKIWPATDPLLFAPLVTVCAFVPLVVIVAIGNLRSRTLALWTAIAIAVCAGLAAYDIFRDPGTPPRDHPQPIVWLALAAGLFIAHSFITAGNSERKYLAAYATDFAVSWKLAVQGALAGAFVAAFWLLLWLGAELFRLIRLEFLAELIKHDWFWIPATTFVFACALHITDARAGLVEGARTLALALLSWLLPVMALFCIAFVLALPFTGLEPLWSTRRATAILLVAAAALVVLINAAYQDGRYASPAPLRYASRAGAFVLIPLVALAAYGLWLRVTQYGWTPERVNACACIVIAGCYAIGYAVAALRARVAGLEATNIATAMVVLAVLLALFTPVADPARIAVADQLRRLADGRVTPEKFDYDFLAYRSGRFGLAALAQLAAQQPGSTTAKRAKLVLDAKTRGEARRGPLDAPARAANITLLHADGQVLPERFLAQDWGHSPQPWRLPACLIANGKCEALMIDLDGDGTAEILLFALPSGLAAAFKAEAGGSWALLGTITNADCAGVRDALRSDPVVLAESRFKEIEVGRDRLRIIPTCGEQNLNARAVPPVKAPP